MENSILNEDDKDDKDFEESSEYHDDNEESSETAEEVSEEESGEYDEYYDEYYDEESIESDEIIKVNPKNGLYISDKELKELEEDCRRSKEINFRKMLILYFLCSLATTIANLVAIMVLSK